MEGAPQFSNWNNVELKQFAHICVLFTFILVAKSTITAMLILQFVLMILLSKYLKPTFIMEISIHQSNNTQL